MISSYTFESEIPGEFKSRLENAINGLDFTPTLAFAFVSVEFPLTKIMDSFRSLGISLFGTTGAGEILFNKIKDTILKKGAVFALTDISTDVYRLQLINARNHAPSNFEKHIGEIIKKTFKNPSIMVAASGLKLDGQALVEGILSKVGNNIKMFGGLAGDDLKFDKTYVFTENDISENGVALLIFDGNRIDLKGMTTSGWIGLGPDFTVTRSEGNRVMEIEDRPALDFYINYLNISEDDLPMIGLEYPFMIKYDDFTTAFRTIMEIDRATRSMTFAGSVPQGVTLSFSISPGFEILENTREKLIHFNEKYKAADLMILYSGVARDMAIGPLISTEIKLAAIKWKVPLAGYFSYGEIGNNDNEVCKFYNQSFTLVLLTEKSAP